MQTRFRQSPPSIDGVLRRCEILSRPFSRSQCRAQFFIRPTRFPTRKKDGQKIATQRNIRIYRNLSPVFFLSFSCPSSLFSLHGGWHNSPALSELRFSPQGGLSSIVRYLITASLARERLSHARLFIFLIGAPAGLSPSPLRAGIGRRAKC